LILLLLSPPLAATLVAIVVRPYRRGVGRASVALAVVSCAASLALCAQALGGAPIVRAATDLWRVDALSALLTLCITFVSLLASALGPGLNDDDRDADAQTVRRFRIFQNAFALTMLVAVTANNVAMMWVAIEATTITSAIAIPLHRTKASVEASWKYLLICSVGIALAFTGTVLASVDVISIPGHLPAALNWSILRDAAPSLHPELMRLAFAFILIGYGTKAGLAPMHTWMPDAYAEAPSPVAAMMSGVLVAVAMYAIARWKSIVDAVVDPSFTSTLLMGVGLVSVAVGAFSLVIQRHYKRMLAYSSIEHMGLVSIGFALGPLGMFAALLHLVNHAVAKAMTFLLAGRILRRYDTTEVAGVSGLLETMPWTGPLFAAGVLTLVGLPPFGLFISEFLLVTAAVTTGHFLVAGAVLVLLLMTFISLLNHLNRMLYGTVPDGVTVGESRSWALLALGGCAVVLIVLGLVLPWPVAALLNQSIGGLIR
jgi:hydrogenase-4 component F